MTTTATQHPREVVRTLVAAVTDACDGKLQDDATVICLDWHGPTTHQRQAHAGANTRNNPHHPQTPSRPEPAPTNHGRPDTDPGSATHASIHTTDTTGLDADHTVTTTR